MALVEKQIVFKRKAENGDTEMHFPVTRAEYVEGSVLTVNGESPDSTGDVTVDDYVTDITISGKTVTITKKDGTSTTQTTQDTTYTLPTATASTKGGVTIGDNITVSSGKISLTKSNVTTALGYTPLQTAPVTSVNSKTGAVSLTASDVGALSTGGGTMTNTIKFSATQALAKTSTSDGLGIYGGTTPLDGAQLVLYGKDSTEEGKFALAANNGTDKVYLYGNADGTLTWNGKNVTVEGDCLPFSGGAMTAAVAMTRDVDSDALQLHGGTSSANGAGLWLYGKDKANLQGTFRLRATANGENVDLIGHKNGTLTWGGKEVERVMGFGESESQLYQRFASGLQILTGQGSGSGAQTITYAVPFKYKPYVVVARRSSASTTSAYHAWGRGGSSTSLNVYTNGNTAFSFIAIGYWE